MQENYQRTKANETKASFRYLLLPLVKKSIRPILQLLKPYTGTQPETEGIRDYN